MKVGHVELFVADPLRSRSFWEAMGFETYDIQSEGKVVWMRLGDRHILLRPGAVAGGDGGYGSKGPAFVLYTDDLPAALERLRTKGVTPCGTDGDPRCPVFRDPDGHWIQLVDPRDHGV